MPIRTASFTKRLSDNGKALHRAMASRKASAGADKSLTEAETALAEERKQLKEQRAQRRAQGLLPGPSPLDKLVRTHRAVAKDKPKVAGEAQGAKDAKEAKKPKATKSRAEKQEQKSAALDAARKTSKKPAK
ncbi:hypothetical protein WG902_19620 [Ramlibacter sp. PS3R-8]|uniref:hypothetical protein n=1 Tax=Ramlibacter sp. PS3R-8 TaxID=3133437 RepID=UPI0030B4269F